MQALAKYIPILLFNILLGNTVQAQIAADWYQQGNEMFEKKDYNGAIDSYNRAIQMDPKYADAFSRRGNAKQRLQDYAGALADFSASIAINPKPSYHNDGISSTRVC